MNEYPRYAEWAAHMASVESALLVLGVIALATVTWGMFLRAYPRLFAVYRVLVVLAFYVSIGVFYLWLG